MLLISEILASGKIPSADALVCCKTTDPTRKAIEQMAANKIGAILVKDADDRLAGVYSERDVVMNCAGNDAGFMEEKLGNVMSAKVIDVSPDQTIDDAMQLMRRHGIRHLPVVEGRDLKGFLSLRDLMVARLDYESEKSEFLKEQVHAFNSPLPM